MIQGLGERLQKERLKLNISQKEAAASLGVSPSIISNYENGERSPSIENLMALATLYHCSTDSLLGLEKKSASTLDVSMLSEKQRHSLQLFLYNLDK